MHRVAVMLLHDDDLARDIVHDVFASMLEGRTPTLLSNGSHNIKSAENYLLKTVRNRCLNHIRDCEIHQRIVNRYFIGDDEYDSEDWPDEETISRIQESIRTDISKQGRRIVELRFVEGKQFSKIASEMGISETAVYRHLRQALILIRQKIESK